MRSGQKESSASIYMLEISDFPPKEPFYGVTHSKASLKPFSERNEGWGQEDGSVAKSLDAQSRGPLKNRCCRRS